MEVKIGAQLIHDHKIVRRKLEKYGHVLAEKPEIVVINKMKLVEEKDREKIAEKFKKETGREIAWVSAGRSRRDQSEVFGLVK